MTELDFESRKNVAYWERNQLVAALSKVYPAFLAKHPESDKDWDPQWRNIVVVILPTEPGEKQDSACFYRIPGWKDKIHGIQLTWHIHDFDMPNFDHLSPQTPENDVLYRGQDGLYQWDRHSTEEKYKRLRTYHGGHAECHRKAV